MTKQVRLVIIGSGIVGCAAAYHLAKFGWRDVLVIDKGDLYENDGSTPRTGRTGAHQPLQVAHTDGDVHVGLDPGTQTISR
ncbi:MAG: FAD-dependent oxidoreductase [Caldilineaceae bacterium]